jgi:hypothetical protein
MQVIKLTFDSRREQSSTLANFTRGTRTRAKPMAPTITGDHMGYPGFSGFEGFFSEEKTFGELSSAWRKWKTNPFSFVKLILKESALIEVKLVSKEQITRSDLNRN